MDLTPERPTGAEVENTSEAKTDKENTKVVDIYMPKVGEADVAPPDLPSPFPVVTILKGGTERFQHRNTAPLEWIRKPTYLLNRGGIRVLAHPSGRVSG